MIVARDLRMAYGSHEAIAGIDLDVRPGELFAFLGPHGAGKTTTVEILEGLRRRTGGDVRVLAADPQAADADWRARIGVVLQDCEPEPTLTVRECLSLCAGYYPRPRPIEETIALVGLAGRADVRCRELSGGERRRVSVALALIGDPELIFLDEPTSGLEPAARRAAWRVIAGLRDLGRTVFLATHDMEEAQGLADRIAVLCAGRIVATGTPRRKWRTGRVSLTHPARPADLAVAARVGAVVAHQARYDLLSFWRRRQCRLLTLALPIAFLVLCTAAFADAAYYVGHLAALGIVSASLTGVVVSVTVERESGILKRRRAAPVSTARLIAGRVASAAIAAAAAVACLLLVGWIAYGVEPRLATLPAIALATAVGTLAFACLGYALASFIRSAQAATAVTLGILLPLVVSSGILVPSADIPSHVLAVADAFPVRHLAQALYEAVDPSTTGSGVAGVDLLVVAGWGVGGIIVAARHFSWEPRR